MYIYYMQNHTINTMQKDHLPYLIFCKSVSSEIKCDAILCISDKLGIQKNTFVVIVLPGQVT